MATESYSCKVRFVVERVYGENGVTEDEIVIREVVEAKGAGEAFSILVRSTEEIYGLDGNSTSVTLIDIVPMYQRE